MLYFRNSFDSFENDYKYNFYEDFLAVGVYLSCNAPYKRTVASICVTPADIPVRWVAYRWERMFFIRCVSDMYSIDAKVSGS